MKKLILILICFVFSVGLSQAQDLIAAKNSTHQAIQLETDRIFAKLVSLRRDFHENPELAGHEVRTRKIITDYLIKLGLEVDSNVYGNGVVGILKGGRKGKKIAWRADMDALPQDFADNIAFRSKKNGIRHGCGHDVHLAIGMGIAEVLAKNKQSLQGTVYFIFQPEEETFIGARGMISDGLLSRIRPDEIYTLHVTALPVGQIMVKSNEVYAYQKRVSIRLKNDVPQENVKALTKKISQALTRTANQSKPWQLDLMLDQEKGLASPQTIFKDYLIMDENFVSRVKNGQLVLEGYIYESDSSRLQNIIPQIRQIIAESDDKDALLSVSFVQENPTVINNEKLTLTAVSTLQNIYGKNVVTADYGQIPYFNDDFAYFQQKIPGVYFFLGGSDFAKGIIAMNHAPDFNVDEECIRTGVKCFSSLIMERGRVLN